MARIFFFFVIPKWNKMIDTYYHELDLEEKKRQTILSNLKVERVA